MSSNEKKNSTQRRAWTLIETRTLLVFATRRRSEFSHLFKKRNVFKNLVEDMTGAGVSDVPFTELEIKTKLKNIKRAYKSALDNNAQTGASCGIGPYKDLLADLYAEESSVEASANQKVASSVMKLPNLTKQETYRETKLKLMVEKEERRKEREQSKQKRHEEKIKIILSQEQAMQKRHEERKKWNIELLNYLKSK